MKKILLLTVGLFSISTAYSMCVPFPLPVKCNCAFPVLEDNKIACGPTYCPAGTECLLDGSCCEGKANALKTECCKNGVDKVVGICCEELSPIVKLKLMKQQAVMCVKHHV